MYHVISTGIIALVLYLVSYLFYRAGIYGNRLHKKIWNTILAFTFLFTALAGLFLALQINYKWEIPAIKTILRWHVEAGIGFSFTAIIHLIWHLSYYFKKDRDQYPEQYETDIRGVGQGTIREYGTGLFLIGFVSSSLQILLLRELMNISGGYELVTGTYLGSWLIGSAAGAAVAGKYASGDLKRSYLVFGLSQILPVVLLIIFSRILLIPGETPSFLISLIITLIVLIPFTFITGYTFIRVLTDARHSAGLSPGKLFSLETAGGVCAGIIVTVFISGLVNTYRLLLVIIVLYLSYVVYSFFLTSKRIRLKSVPFAFAVLLSLVLFDPDVFFRKLLLPAISVSTTKDTPYGNITKAGYGGETTVYYDHHLLQWQNDEIEREENVHYALVQRDSYRNVLVVSGDIRSNLNELSKYSIGRIYFVERDPALLKYQVSGEDTEMENTVIVHDDALRFIRNTKEVFDAILLILPPPSTLQMNRFYTTDFFIEARSRMSDSAVLMCSPGAGENYYNIESTILNSSVYNSLSSVFRNVLPVVGSKLYYLASDGDLTTSICQLIDNKGIRNNYVGSDFLADDLIKMKSEQMAGTIDKSVRQNTLSVPVAVFHYQNYNFSKTTGERIPAIVIMGLIFLLPVFFINARNMIMFSSAGVLAGFEIVSLLILQSTVGSMYQYTGLLISFVMAGLAAGAWTVNRHLDFFNIPASSLAIFIVCLAASFSANIILKLEDTIIIIAVLMIILLIPSFFTGRIFRLLTEKYSNIEAPSGVYTADLTGSALGFIIISSTAVPLAGIQMTQFLLSALIFIGFLFGTIVNK